MMMYSCPPPLFHPLEQFKYRHDLEAKSSNSLEISDDVQSIHSGQDDDSIVSGGDYFPDNNAKSSSFVDLKDRPLNLSCKRRRMEEHPTKSPCSSDLDSPTSVCDIATSRLFRQENAPEANEKVNLSASETFEQAVMRYRAQVLASSDIVRVLMQQHRWNEEMTCALQHMQSNPLSTTMGHTGASWMQIMGLRAFEQARVQPNVRSYGNLCSTFGKSHIDASNVATNGRYLPSPSSVSTSPISSPSTSPPIDLKGLSPTTCPPGYLFIGNKNVAPHSPTSSLESLSHDSHFAKVPSMMEKNRHEIITSPLRGETVSPFSTSPKPDAITHRRRSKRNDKSNATNSNGDSFPCSICGASYPHKFELNRHVKVSHIRPHRCNECGKGFGHRNYLKVHIETVHMGRKSHQCRLCGKYLSTGGNLNVHVRTIHLGEKKFNCPVCNRSFGQQCNMKTHMKRHYTKSDVL